LDISNKELDESLSLSDFVNLEELDCSYNELTNLDINDCCDKFFFREEIEKKVEYFKRHFKNLVRLSLDLKKYREKESEFYSEILSGIAERTIDFAKEKDEQQKVKLENDLERIRNSLGFMDKAIFIIINSDDPDQIVIKLPKCKNCQLRREQPSTRAVVYEEWCKKCISSDSNNEKKGDGAEEANDEEISADSLENEITLNVKEVEQKAGLESLKEVRKQVLYGQTALESILKHERLQKFQKFLSSPFREAYQCEKEIKNKLFKELKNDFYDFYKLWESNDRKFKPMELDRINLIVENLNDRLNGKDRENAETEIKKELTAEMTNNVEEEIKKILTKLLTEMAKLKKELLDVKIGEYQEISNNVNYYGSKNAELYMLYTHVLKKELPEYIKRIKEELGTKFVRFSEKFKKVKGESFGDYVAKKLADSDDFYFSPDRV
ncbi:1806_t:CDS:2, partial [Ambispora gerdemannii]